MVGCDSCCLVVVPGCCWLVVVPGSGWLAAAAGVWGWKRTGSGLGTGGREGAEGRQRGGVRVLSPDLSLFCPLALPLAAELQYIHAVRVPQADRAKAGAASGEGG